MKATYDREADALYMEFSSNKSARTKKIDDFTMIDYDESGKIIGIELLEASKKLPVKAMADSKQVQIKIEHVFLKC